MAPTARRNGPGRDDRGPTVALGPLDAQERHLARLVAAGLSDAEIATRLGLDVAAVQVALEAVFGKLHLRSRTELALLAAGESVGNTAWTAQPR